MDTVAESISHRHANPATSTPRLFPADDFVSARTSTQAYIDSVDTLARQLARRTWFSKAISLSLSLSLGEYYLRSHIISRAVNF